MNLPNLEELPLRSVAALPKASSSGLVASTRSATLASELSELSEPLELPGNPSRTLQSISAVDRYCISSLTVSVLPAPDSPDTRTL